MTQCNQNDCNKESVEVVETWVGSVPIYYHTCKQHGDELKRLNG